MQPFSATQSAYSTDGSSLTVEGDYGHLGKPEEIELLILEVRFVLENGVHSYACVSSTEFEGNGSMTHNMHHTGVERQRFPENGPG